MRFVVACPSRALRGFLVVVATVLATVGIVVSAPHEAGAAAGDTGSIKLQVTSARSVHAGPGYIHFGDVVPNYKWLINVDDTGDPGTATDPGLSHCLPATAPGGSSDPDYADSCQWPSTRTTAGFAPIVAQGDQNDLSTTKALADLPVGKYLISVTADDYKIDGAHFIVTGGSSATVHVTMQPLPLPLTTLRLQVFNDNAPVDATYEVDAEPGLANFTAAITDVLGLVSTDYYGNALCTRYLRRSGTRNISTPVDSALPIAFDANNRPIVDPLSIGKCVSDRTGLIVIPNLGPNRYAATVSAPALPSGQWVQTTTLEGGHDHDIWQQEGETGNDTEQTKGAELVPSVQFGFVRTQAVRLPSRGPAPTGEIKGVAIAGLPYIGGQNGQVVPETRFARAQSRGPLAHPGGAPADLP